MKNNWQKLLAIVLVLALCATMLAVFTACGEAQLIDKKGTATIVVASATEGQAATSYTVDLSKVTGKDGLIAVLDYLKAAEGLTYDATVSETGAFLNSVNDIKNDYDKKVYLYIYTTVEADYDTSTYASTTQYNGLTLTSVGVGASLLHIKNGSTVYIGTVQW